LHANTLIDIDTVTRNILLPVDYNILFYLESQWDRLWGDEGSRIFDRNYQGDSIEHPVIIQYNRGIACNVVIFQKGNNNAIKLVANVDLDLRIIHWGAPLSFFAGGGLLGWGKHKLDDNSKYSRYYLFSWYKILHTKRLTSGIDRADDYLRYYYYYQYII
jgi:hypothetical protein